MEDGISDRGKSRRIEEIIVFALDQNPDGRVLLSKNTIKDIVDRIVNIVDQTREADGLLTEAYPSLGLTAITEIRNILNSNTKLVASSTVKKMCRFFYTSFNICYRFFFLLVTSKLTLIKNSTTSSFASGKSTEIQWTLFI